jgi:hypothetical protein
MSEDAAKIRQQKTAAMADAIAALLDNEDIAASARACADGFNRVFATGGFTAKLLVCPLVSFEGDEQIWQNRL